jgi:aminopeptidase N
VLAFLIAVAQAGDERFRDYPETDVLAYDIELVLDPAAQTVSGKEHVRIRAQRELSAVRLDARASPEWKLEFRPCPMAETEQPLSFARETEDRVSVALPHTVKAGEEFTLEADFAGKPPDGLYFARSRYGEPWIYTDHYSVRARGWLPCEDHPGDRALFSLALTVPEALEVVGTGGLERTQEPAPPGFVLWRGACASEIPTYLLAFAAGPWARVPEAGDPRLRAHFVYRQDVDNAKKALVHHAAWLAQMERVFGPYPYASYCVAQVPTRWGGMENAGNTWVMESLFDARDAGPAGVGVLAHEFAHQWFGDGVGYADWQEVWLSEGFASFFGPWLDAQTGGQPLAEALRGEREEWLASKEGRVLPVRWRGFLNPDSALNANSYPKGAWILRMLEKELGDKTFFAGLTIYYRQNVGRAVTTAAFRTTMEHAARHDLGVFFQQWLERPGCPELSFTWTPDDVTVRQLQESEPFDFLLPLRWTGADGTTHDHDFRIRERETKLTLESAPAKDGVVDPNVELLYRTR